MTNHLEEALELRTALGKAIDAMYYALDAEPFGTAPIKAESEPIPYRYAKEALNEASFLLRKGFEALERSALPPVVIATNEPPKLDINDMAIVEEAMRAEPTEEHVRLASLYGVSPKLYAVFMTAFCLDYFGYENKTRVVYDGSIGLALLATMFVRGGQRIEQGR